MLHRHFFAALVLSALCSSVAYGSSDAGCFGPPRGNISHRDYDSCSSVPFLSPGNDTQLNLQLLLIDSGKLKGNLKGTPQLHISQDDQARLLVPFDMADFGVHEPSAGSDKGRNDDASGASDYAQGEGSRCRNSESGMGDFLEALKAATSLPAKDAEMLSTARTTLVANCESTEAAAWKAPTGIHSALGRQFATYIAGANAFYEGDFPTALKDFNSLQNSPDPWLRQVSLYMVGRTQINSAQQQAFGEWGALQLEKVNKAALSAANAAFDDYLQRYPNGPYAASARGLLRRVYWLGGDQTRLAAAYEQAFTDSTPSARNVTLLGLLQEFESKLLPSVKVDQIKSPYLLAIVDLMRMRSTGEKADAPSVKDALTLADLQAQKDRFASKPALYTYLCAAFHLYVDAKPEQALALLPAKIDAQLNYFAFSQQTLRVLALEASHRPDEARQLLLQLMPLVKLPMQREQLELQLAMLEERTGHVDRVFAAGSPITGEAIRTTLAEHSLSADLLRQRIKDPKETVGVRDAAVYTLLYKELTGAKYQAFQSDLALVSAHPSAVLAPFVAAADTKEPGYKCPALREVAATLQNQADDARSLNCVGEFVRIHGVHYGQAETLPKSDLGGAPSPFPDTNYSRMDGYLKVIANDHADSDARAYALARAVRCFAPSGSNDCGTQNIPQSTRKQWFHVLKTNYADSVWAKSLKYFW